jgi:hypothetical protein
MYTAHGSLTFPRRLIVDWGLQPQCICRKYSVVNPDLISFTGLGGLIFPSRRSIAAFYRDWFERLEEL